MSRNVNGIFKWSNKVRIAEGIKNLSQKVMPKHSRKVVNYVGTIGVRTMRDVSRVDTGDMRSSISKKNNRRKYEVEVMLGYGVGSDRSPGYNVYIGREEPEYTEIAEAKWGYTVHRGNSAKRANKTPHHPMKPSAEIAAEAMEAEFPQQVRWWGREVRKDWNKI